MLWPMNENTFWELIAECTPQTPDPDAEQLAATLTARLSDGPITVVTGFAEQLSWALYRLDREEYCGDLSGDPFLYTRAAVVAAGRAAHEAVLHDPSNFAPYAAGLVWAESLLYVPDRAYLHLTGEEWQRETRYSYETGSNAEGWAAA